MIRGPSERSEVLAVSHPFDTSRGRTRGCGMSDDLTQTQAQGGESWQRAREVSLRHRLPPAPGPGYEIEACVGGGAYGEVWLAKIQNNPGRRVAIKFYTRRSGDWALLAREVEK